MLCVSMFLKGTLDSLCTIPLPNEHRGWEFFRAVAFLLSLPPAKYTGLQVTAP